ncbi:uncharacterized protein LOC100905850 [Galendromus occidentalis]|uniref:Uncharacterized protein LOC100905850 n=1 Tax=Galendromus occidentalis TaxID=34638 RepID=A0AAJ6QNA5_9ACAR|nr:uncharacterized protein LOC100905850 [Galendromus occidentalis]
MARINETLCEGERPCPFQGSLCDITLKRCICAMSHVYNHRSDSCEPACMGPHCGLSSFGNSALDLGNASGWPITAAHIAAMFTACILILAVCHLIIRLYMRSRETAFLRNHNRSYLESLVVRGATIAGPDGPVIAGAAPQYDSDEFDIACSRPPGYFEVTRTTV